MTTQTRFFKLEARANTGDEYDVSLASEYPVDRGGYIEVLDVTTGAVDLARAVDGLPLLSDHSRTRLGRIHALRVQAGKLRGRLRFFDTPAGREARAEVDGGHREVSVGYEVLKTENSGETLRVTRWRPYEGSIVAVPADPTVGINRSIHEGKTMSTTQSNTTADGAGGDASDMTRAHRRAAGRQAADETERVASIARLARAFPKHLKPHDIADAIENGTSLDKFQDMIFSRMETGFTDATTVPGPGYIRHAGDPESRFGDFSMTRAIAANVDPATHMRTAGMELELSRELQRRGGIQSPGIMVPMEVMFPTTGRRDLLAGSGSGAGLVQTTVMPVYVEALRQRSVVLSMGATLMPNLTGPMELPRQTVTSSVGWKAEDGSLDETQPVFAPVTLSPKRVGGFVEISRRLQMTSVFASDQMLQQDLSRSCMSELDRVSLGGAEADALIPKGVRWTAGIGAVIGGANGATLTWGHILDLEKSVDDLNGLQSLQNCGYVINPGTRSYLKRTARHATLSLGMIMGDTANDELGFNVLNGYRCGVTAKQPGNLVKGSGTALSLMTFGDWSQLIIGVFGGGVEVLVDPYTLAPSGLIRITANLYADIGIRQPGSFATMEDAKLS